MNQVLYETKVESGTAKKIIALIAGAALLVQGFFNMKVTVNGILLHSYKIPYLAVLLLVIIRLLIALAAELRHEPMQRLILMDDAVSFPQIKLGVLNNRFSTIRIPLEQIQSVELRNVNTVVFQTYEGLFSVKGVAGAAAFADAVNSTLANRQLIAQQERAALPVYPKKPAIDAETLRSLKSQLETGAITREQYDAALRSYQTKDWNEHE